ncbi:MAG TPA: VCBS repeat-containing protein, partial [Vicinamibacterales bacterium]|nr:VCBS repeat-containing protein [Vicinamibacterales bacterium]
MTFAASGVSRTDLRRKGHAVLLAFFFFAGCNAASTPPPAAAPTGWFTERAAETGLKFTHFNGMAGGFYYPEIMPPGVALFDYDNDGDLDVFVVQGQMLGNKPLSAAKPQPEGPLNSRLFRNDLKDGVLHFTDVTAASGIVTKGYAMGVATADVDNDGCVDLYVTEMGPNQLFRNNCDGTFTDVSKQSRTDDAGWSVSATFFDYDRDGWVDLFVGNYVDYSIEANKQCFSLQGSLDYCPPHVYRAAPSHLYHNNHDGTFTDVTAKTGIAREYGPALGSIAADFNGDGWPDLYVANDGQPNQLWINQRDGTFRNTALLAGAALSPEGEAKSSMGIDAGDFDNDGDEDIFITELTGQGHDLYVNDGKGAFEDASARAGIRLASLPYTGFGAGWIDIDNDGWLDLVTVNGAVTQNIEALARNEPFSLQQKKQVFRNLGNGQFEDATRRAGSQFEVPEVSRGLAFGDIDNDGDMDMVVGNDSGPLRLFINNVGSRKHWVGFIVPVGSR